MTKQEILEKLNEKKGAESDSTVKERLDHICDMLRLMPDEGIEKEIPEIVTYLNGTSSILSNDLDTALTKLKDWSSKLSVSVEGIALDEMNKRTKRALTAFLVVIGILAVAAVPFALLNFFLGESFCWGRGDDVATVLGTLDFAIGAMGFIWERKDDMKKRQLRVEAEKAKATGNAEKFISIVNQNITNSNVASGAFSKVVDKSKTINNYSSQN